MGKAQVIVKMIPGLDQIRLKRKLWQACDFFESPQVYEMLVELNFTLKQQRWHTPTRLSMLKNPV